MISVLNQCELIRLTTRRDYCMELFDEGGSKVTVVNMPENCKFPLNAKS